MNEKRERCLNPGIQLMDLPEDFDRSKIVMPGLRKSARDVALYLCQSDFAPIERRGFSGYFAMRDILQGGKMRSMRLKIAMDECGGKLRLTKTISGRRAFDTEVRVLHAWRDREYVVVHMEPWKGNES